MDRATLSQVSIVSDRFPCFGGVTEAGCPHQAIKTDRVPRWSGSQPKVGLITLLATGVAITGTYRSITSKHVPRDLAEFEQPSALSAI